MSYSLRSCHTHNKLLLPGRCQCSFSLEANPKTYWQVQHNIQEMKTIPGHCTSVQQYNSNRLSGKQVVHQSKKLSLKKLKRKERKDIPVEIVVNNLPYVLI